MFNQFSHFGNNFIHFGSLGNSYNPLINYTWQTKVIDNKMTLVDAGRRPAYNAEMNSGKGILFNGVDQQLDFTNDVVGATSMMYRIDGVPTYTENLFYIFDTNNVYKDIFYFNDTLTQQEITKYSEQPNDFFQDVQDGVIDNCVLNMPLDGDGKYVRDYANYSELEKVPAYADGTLDSVSYYVFGDDGSGLSKVDDTVTQNGKSTVKVAFNITTDNATALLDRTISNDTNYLQNGNKYYIECSFKSEKTPSSVRLTTNTSKVISSEPYLDLFSTDGDWIKYRGIVEITSIENATGIVCVMAAYNDIPIGTLDTWVGNDYKMYELSGVNQISNYTTAARDTTSTLNYSTQETKFFRFGLWRGGLSPFLELDGQKPALKIPMTDTELWEINHFIQFDFVLRRQLTAERTFLISSRSGSTGLKIQASETNYDQSFFFVAYPNGVIGISLNEDIHHISITINETEMYITIDGVDGTPVSHSFVPSGLNIADSIQPAPTGELRSFNIHTVEQDTQELYKKAVDAGLLKSFLVDANGDYVVDSNGNYILVN